MRYKSYFPQLLEAIRETLRLLEGSTMTSDNEPFISELKTDFRRKLDEYERASEPESLAA